MLRFPGVNERSHRVKHFLKRGKDRNNPLNYSANYKECEEKCTCKRLALLLFCPRACSGADASRNLGVLASLSANGNRVVDGSGMEALAPPSPPAAARKTGPLCRLTETNKLERLSENPAD